ncbi:MAG: family 20 glycosylhydrolase [Verrucomicrobia bacterium]|nr:family 20 glycosylhydrolase [Verrucomicrobiota bacterium]
MKTPALILLAVLTASACGHAADAKLASATTLLPIRGIHLSAPSKRDLPMATEFIRKTLAKEGVNTLILEFNFGFDYRSRPEFSNPSALDKADVQQIVQACRAASIELIPQINCLGHQSWSERTDKLLQKHPEFDETPGKYPGNKGIYCRSYCPLHPEVHKVLSDLIDELAKACEAKSFHVGMDEVFILADPDCPRCKGKDPAELLAGEVKTLHAHLKEIGCRLWMWGDRFLDGKATRIGKWEASENGTHPAVDLVPKDIVICDWHYEKAHDTPRFFAGKGFQVVACPWRKADVALGELDRIRTLRAGDDRAVAERALGMVHTTWCGFAPFVRACQAQPTNAVPAKSAPAESAHCFTTLFKAIRGE